MIFIVSFGVFAVIIAGMAVGVMAGREPISGSCGGVGRLGIEQKCEICGDDPQKCDATTSKDMTGDTGVRRFDPQA